MAKIAIFDFNGTLVDDTKEWWICVLKIFEEAGIKDNVPDIEKFIEALDNCGGVFAAYQFFGVKLEAEQITTAYIKAYANLIGNINPYPSTQKTLIILRNYGTVCALVTFNWNSLLLPMLNRLNLSGYFKHIAAEVRDKTSAIRDICETENAEPKDCYYVGDMPSDIVSARLAGVKSVALLTEMVPTHLIDEKQPDYKISDLEELPRIMIR